MSDRRSQYCFNCNKKEKFETFMDMSSSGFREYVLLSCSACGAVAAFHEKPEAEGAVAANYNDYNHLSTFSADELIKRTQNVSYEKRRVLNEIRKTYSEDAVIVDFGGGSGAFVKSCHLMGFRNTYLFEPSKVLLDIARNTLGIPADRIVSNVADIRDDIDVVMMLDVIEHLPVDTIRPVFESLTLKMSPSASIIGMTPNLRSLNIALHGEKDPVIAPPNHTIYFSSRILEEFLTQFGFGKHKAFTIGMSTNSFFRREKFSPSWVERPKGAQRYAARIIRTLFKGLGVAMMPFGKGYHCFFWYRLKS